MKPSIVYKEVGHLLGKLMYSGSSNGFDRDQSPEDNEITGRNKFFNAFRSLKHKNFLMFWFNSCLWDAASWSITLVSTWLTYSITQSAFATALVVGLPTISSIVISPIIGVLADGMSRKRLLIYISLVQGVVISIFAVLVFIGQISIWYIYLLVFINGVFANARSPLRMSIIPNLVPRNFVLNALSLQTVANSSVRFLLPVTMGFVIKFFGEGVVLAISAILYTLSTLFLLKISVEFNKHYHVSAKEIGVEFLQGVRYLIREKLLLGTTCLIFIMLFCITAINLSMMPVYSVKVFDAGPEGAGILVACTGIGITLAGILTSFRTTQDGINHFVMIRLAFAISIMYIIFSRITIFEIGAFNIIISMMLLGMFWLSTEMHIQQNVDESYRGRVSSLVVSGASVALLLGFIFLGYISDLVGVQNATLLSSLILVICMVTFLILRQRIFTTSNSADEIVGGIREKGIAS